MNRNSDPTERDLMEVFGVFTRPLIVMPGYTDMEIPENISGQIQMERLILTVSGDKMASETETMWYLSTASLCFPLSGAWYRIYMYLFRRWCTKTQKEIPDFVSENIVLEEYEESDLKRLRDWLYLKSKRKG